MSASLACLIGASIHAPALGGGPAAAPEPFPEGWRELAPGESPFSSLPFSSPPFGRRDLGLDGLGKRPVDELAKPSGPTRETAAARVLRSKAERAERLKKALAARPSPATVRQQMLDDLFTRLHSAVSPDEAQGVAQAIERIWLHSRSDTANLLMERALSAIKDQHYPLALTLLDRLVSLEPDWAEAWNQRATTRFLADDVNGAMADIDQVMKLEPRHFSALAGMGMILQRAGLEKRALEIFKRALEIYPQQPDLEKSVEKLTLEIEGRDI
ncbi:tetratricopeptide repeat protein [Methylocapsa aurea]|uniref:tetratricopeptide repeat protein n=1 Tax=Methylocapsa aurea TaxID=663610 RepID=UPI0012EB84C6|nr:tetratricopeptide repeat protein [Methylocapsa aurea]